MIFVRSGFDVKRGEKRTKSNIKAEIKFNCSLETNEQRKVDNLYYEISAHILQWHIKCKLKSRPPLIEEAARIVSQCELHVHHARLNMSITGTQI